MQITEHFAKEEFTDMPYEALPKRSKLMILGLAYTLEIIKKAVGNKPIRINSAVRKVDDFMRLKEEGYNPSPTSDHYFGFEIPLEKGSAAYKKYSSYYNLSVGAVDIVCPSLDTIEFFNKILKLSYSGQIKTGQILLEKNKSFWVHIAGNPNDFLMQEARELRGELSCYGKGYSLDNGKSFEYLEFNEFFTKLQ